VMTIDDIIENVFRRSRRNDHHEGTRNRASQGGRCEKRITSYVCKNPPDSFHLSLKLIGTGQVSSPDESNRPQIMR
jgi:hypothetical protein